MYSESGEDGLRVFAERANEPTVPFEEIKGNLNWDIEKMYSTAEFVAKLRRLADALESGEKFEIQIAGERIYVSVRAEFNVEHEREGDDEEIEFQIRWTNQPDGSASIRSMRGFLKGIDTEIHREVDGR